MSRRQRIAAAMVVVVGLLTIGFATGFGSEESAEPAVQAFLFDWEQGKYAQAAALTSGDTGQVATQLAAAFVDLDATSTALGMQSVVQHGNSAVATFTATVDLAEGSHQWSYTGRFGLTKKGGQWLINWAPSVIDPNLGPGDRLAVLTAFAPRAQIEDSAGQPLVLKSTDYHIGVYPGRLTDAAQTAAQFGQLAGLNSQQVLGQIRSAPPRGFLSLLTLDPSSFRAIWPRLDRVRGISFERRAERLFDTGAGIGTADLVGAVETEDASELRAEGAAYQPGVTVGVSGLEQAYQGMLAGTPTTAVVVVDGAGHVVATLWRSAGLAGVPLRTTVDGRFQQAAVSALATQPDSGEIVAVDAANGDILALASHEAGSVPLPRGGTLDARVKPGMSFSIVSAAALLGIGYDADRSLPCRDVATIGGQTFTYQPGRSTAATFASDFAAGCGTAFATVSQYLNSAQLAAVEKDFGIGANWDLRLPAFSGSVSDISGAADLAAQATGTGGVLMSPLGMAMVAAEVDAGTGHVPVLIATDPAAAWQAPLSASKLTELRQLMRQAVQSGSAHAADVSGQPVYGQAGVVQTGAHAWLSWFVGYRGSMAVAVLETGTSPAQAAASLAGAFLSTAR
jgi:cell division protein FtsI/penicillin-binding protein 2